MERLAASIIDESSPNPPVISEGTRDVLELDPLSDVEVSDVEVSDIKVSDVEVSDIKVSDVEVLFDVTPKAIN